MLLVDTHAGQIISDEEIKHQLASEHPYRDWLNKYQVRLQDLPYPNRSGLHQANPSSLVTRQRGFGYTEEDLRLIIASISRKLD